MAIYSNLMSLWQCHCTKVSPLHVASELGMGTVLTFIFRGVAKGGPGVPVSPPPLTY